MAEPKPRYLTTDEMIERARKAGVAVRVVTPQGTGEIAPLPGVRHEDDFDESAPERDDDGTGTDE